MHSNGWQRRNKEEGPRKISDLHAEVARKKLEQDRRDAMERMSSGGRYGGDGFRRGGSMGPPAPSGPGRSRNETTMDAPMKNLGKVPSTQDLTNLRPGGGFGRGGAGGRAPSPAAQGAPPPRLASRPSSQASSRGGEATPVAATPTAAAAPPVVDNVETYEVEQKAVNQCVTLLEQVKALLAAPSDRLSEEEALRIREASTNDVLVELSLCAKEYGSFAVACGLMEAAKKARGFASDELQTSLQHLIGLAVAPTPELPDKPGTAPIVGAGEMARSMPWVLHQVGSWVEDKPVMGPLVRGCVVGGWCGGRICVGLSFVYTSVGLFVCLQHNISFSVSPP